MTKTMLAAAAAAGVLAFSVPAAALETVSIGSDAAWNAYVAQEATLFTKIGGTNVRRGNNAGNGDWEYAVVNASDVPVGTPGQIAWGASADLTPNSAQPGFATYLADGATTLAFAHNGDRSHSAGLAAGANTIWIRARTGGAGTNSAASFEGLVIELLDDGSLHSLGNLFGDSDAEYLGVTDDRLAGGFRLRFDRADFDIGSAQGGSSVMLQVKIGQAPFAPPVPEPGTWALMIGGFGLVGAAMRRRPAPALG